MTSKWEKTLVSDLGHIVTGKTPKTSVTEYYGGDVPFLTPSDNMDVKRITNTARTLSPSGVMSIKNCLIPENSICVSCIGSGLGKVVMTTTPTVTNQQINSIIPNKHFDPDYIYYAMCILGEKLNYVSKTSTAVPIVNKSSFSKFTITVPLLTEQKAISKTLSALDDKIELNNRINKNLEEMAQAIFKHWFVGFEFPDENGNPYKSSGGEMIESELGDIPKGWRVGILGDLLDNIKNSEKAGVHIKDIPYLPIDCIPMNSLSLNECNSGGEAKSSLIRFSKDDILIGAMRVYFHRVVLAPFDGITRTTCFVLRPKHKYMTPFALLLCNLDSTIEYAQNTSQGSTMPYAVWDGGLQKLKIIVPNKDILVNFYKIISPVIEQIRDSLFEKNTLAVIRKSLLPKLMSGEIRVSMEEAI